jgi:hypothetical protein
MENINYQSINTNKQQKISTYSVNPIAESVVNILATILFIIGFIISFVSIVGGIILLTDDVWSYPAYGIGLIVGGIVWFIISIIQWAWFKIIVNISRNLFNINEQLKHK